MCIFFRLFILIFIALIIFKILFLFKNKKQFFKHLIFKILNFNYLYFLTSEMELGLLIIWIMPSLV